MSDAETEIETDMAVAPSQFENEVPRTANNFGSISRIPVTVQVVLGTVVMPVSRLMNLGRGELIALDRRVGEPVEIVVNGRIVARGEIVVLEDDNARFGISLTDVASDASDFRA